jgi:predicted ATP-dependent endonuclease of OLD family
MLGFKGSRTAANLDVQFGFADPSNPHSALRLLCRQHGLLLPAEALGAGEQSALVVGLFEAFRQKGTSLSTILLEEPEMYLYPQAQRYFKHILVDLVEKNSSQLIIATHSPIFADVARFNDLRVLRKRQGSASSSTSVAQVRTDEDRSFLADQLEREKLSQYIDSRNAELLFARGVLLVEGHGDRLAAAYVASALDIDLDAEGLSIISCGGKSAVPFFARLCRSLSIPFVILHDTDLYEGDELADWMKNENQAAPRRNQAIVDAAGTDAVILTVSPTLESALRIARTASDKPRRVIAALQGLQQEDFPIGLVDAVYALSDLVLDSRAPQQDET